MQIGHSVKTSARDIHKRGKCFHNGAKHRGANRDMGLSGQAASASCARIVSMSFFRVSSIRSSLSIFRYPWSAVV